MTGRSALRPRRCYGCKGKPLEGQLDQVGRRRHSLSHPTHPSPRPPAAPWLAATGVWAERHRPIDLSTCPSKGGQEMASGDGGEAQVSATSPYMSRPTNPRFGIDGRAKPMLDLEPVHINPLGSPPPCAPPCCCPPPWPPFSNLGAPIATSTPWLLSPNSRASIPLLRLACRCRVGAHGVARTVSNDCLAATLHHAPTSPLPPHRCHRRF